MYSAHFSRYYYTREIDRRERNVEQMTMETQSGKRAKRDIEHVSYRFIAPLLREAKRKRLEISRRNGRNRSRGGVTMYTRAVITLSTPPASSRADQARRCDRIMARGHA